MAKNHANKSCAVVGDINIDIITPPFEMPGEIGESSIVLDDFSYSLGGNAINVAAELSALEADVSFHGAIGDGPISQWIRSKCGDLKIKTHLHQLENSSAGITFALTLHGGKRQFIATLGTNAKLSPEHLNEQEILKSSHLHRSGFWYTPQIKGDFTIKLMKKMISNSKQTSLDVGWDPDGFTDENTELLFKTLEYTEFFFANEKELKAITRKGSLDEALDVILNITTSIDNPYVIVHQGANGSLIKSRNKAIKIGTKDVPQINPTGTGDIYNAGFIYGLLNDWDPERTGKFADTVACVHLSDKSKIYPGLDDL